MITAQKAHDIATISCREIDRFERWLLFIEDMAHLGKLETIIHVYKDRKNPDHLTVDEKRRFQELGFKLHWDDNRHGYIVKW